MFGNSGGSPQLKHLKSFNISVSVTWASPLITDHPKSSTCSHNNVQIRVFTHKLPTIVKAEIGQEAVAWLLLFHMLSESQQHIQALSLQEIRLTVITQPVMDHFSSASKAAWTLIKTEHVKHVQ